MSAPDLQAARDELTDLGYDVIPIIPGSKRPVRHAWQTMPPPEQWKGALPEHAFNVGLRHGGALRLASMEAERDRPEAIPALRRYLAGLGYDLGSYPANLTAHAGERYFFALLDAPDGDTRRMAADLGGGELRYGPGAQALIPPSVLADGGRYAMIAGAWDGELPKLTRADIAPLLADGGAWGEPMPEVAPTPISAFAQAVADGENLLPEDVRKRLKGQGGKNYPSQDDYTIVLRLATLGIDENITLALMLAHPGYGHFSDLAAKDSAAAVAWLHHAYARASVTAANGGDVSKRLARLIVQAEAEPWPGRTGATDKAIYLAHLRIAHNANTSVWVGAARRLAEMVNVGHMTATRATHRLIQAGKLQLHTAATAQLAAEYALPDIDSVQDDTLQYVGTNLSVSSCTTAAGKDSQEQPTKKEKEEENRGEQPEPKTAGVQSPSGVGVLNQTNHHHHPQRPLSPKAGRVQHTPGTQDARDRSNPDTEKGRVQEVMAHDVFCWRHGLGKSTGLVYAALLAEPCTVDDLVRRTGRHASTVKRALKRLATVANVVTGELHPLAEEAEPGTWEAVEGADLDKAARLLGVDGIGEKRALRHEQERQRHAAALELIKDGAPVPHPNEPPPPKMPASKTRGKTRQELRQ